MTNELVPLTTFHGVVIHTGDSELVSLNDLWKAAGSPPNREPRYWRRQPQTVAFIEHVRQKLNVSKTHIYRAERGRHGGGPWGHWKVALGYAAYLSVELKDHIYEVFRERVEEDNDPELGFQRWQERTEQEYAREGHPKGWIGARVRAIVARKWETDALKEHGITEGGEYARLTNETYRGLFGGGAQGLKAQRGLAKGDNLRDDFNELELTEVAMAELCRGLEEPERPAGKTGRKPVPIADQVFASVFKVYSTFSSRRFNTDLEEAHAKGHLSRPIHPNKVNAFLESEELTPVLNRLITVSSLPLRAAETTFAPDSTGFSASRFVRWFDEKYGGFRSGKAWVKAHAMTGVKTNIVTAVVIADRNAGDSPQFKELVETTARNFTVKEVPADKAYLSHENLELLHNTGGTAFVPSKSNSLPGEPESVWGRMYHYYQFGREEFLKHYHQRSNAGSTFGTAKAKFRDHVRSKTDAAQKNEVLAKFLCRNRGVVIQSQCELAWH